MYLVKCWGQPIALRSGSVIEDVGMWWPFPFQINYYDFIVLIKLFSENTTERDLCYATSEWQGIQITYCWRGYMIK